MEESKTNTGSGSGSRVIKLIIETDSRLTETLSDYLVGIIDAAVEFTVDNNGPAIVVHGFVQDESDTIEYQESLEQQVRAFAGEMALLFCVPTPRISSEIVPDQDWSHKWKEHFSPFEIVPKLVIAPSWEIYNQTAGEQVIVMDPGMAFGTGHHATTRLCLELLKDALRQFPGCDVLDVGTGTGILGMAAALFGASRVAGIDNDPEAVDAAQKNIRKNNLAGLVEISGYDLAMIDDTYQIVVANIVHDVLLELAEDLARVTADGGVLVLSGLIHGEQTENMVHCFQARSFMLQEQGTDEEWGALQLVKASGTDDSSAGDGIRNIS